MSFVEMESTDHENGFASVEVAKDEFSGVALHGGCFEMGNVLEGN